MLRRTFRRAEKGKFSKANVMRKKADPAENGEIQIEQREPCKKGHDEFLEDFTQIRNSFGTFEGWAFRFRCLDCNAARNESRMFDEKNYLGG